MPRVLPSPSLGDRLVPRACRILAVVLASAPVHAQTKPAITTNVLPDRRAAAKMLVGYFEAMCTPKPFVVRKGDAFGAHQKALREKLLRCASLWPLPERIGLDVRQSKPLDHEWCTVRRVYYRLWLDIYANGLLFLPKRSPDGDRGPVRKAPAVLCPHGHWPGGHAHPEVQRRCLVLAKMGYVVLSPAQRHYEDLPLGISHQTHMIWTNVRGVDYLQSLPQVDPKRIGCAGCSGGGLQTQMLVAVDPRIRAATIAGMTCDYREIVFPGRNHCACNHFPNIMRYTDEPELSALGLPAAVQYLTMNDWTRPFERTNYPTVAALYQANGAPGRTDCRYWPTPHSYDQPKRERTYGWMERWLRDKKPFAPVDEPKIKTFPPATLAGLKTAVPEDKGLPPLSKLVGDRLSYKAPVLTTKTQWRAYRQKMLPVLDDLLGQPAACEGSAAARRVNVAEADGLVVERALCPSERGVAVPVVVLRKAGAAGRLPAVVMCDDRGKGALLAGDGPDGAKALARRGHLVAVCDVRFVGELSLAALAGQTKGLLAFRAASPLGEGKPGSFEGVWQRNALLWGRPLPGMAATDLQAVARYLASRTDARGEGLSLRARGKVAIAALLAAAGEPKITTVHADLQSRCFRKRNLPVVPFVLRYGDVLQWSALLADRTLTLTGLPAEAGKVDWLRAAFQAAENPKGLHVPRSLNRPAGPRGKRTRRKAPWLDARPPDTGRPTLDPRPAPEARI